MLKALVTKSGSIKNQPSFQLRKVKINSQTKTLIVSHFS